MAVFPTIHKTQSRGYGALCNEATANEFSGSWIFVDCNDCTDKAFTISEAITDALGLG